MKMHFKHWHVLIVGLVLFSWIQGCSTLGIGEPDYACTEPGKGVCKSARQVYEDTHSPALSRASFQPFSKPANQAYPDKSVVTLEAVPNRTPAQVLRIWLAPWVDKQGNWHSGGLIMTDIVPRHWQSAVQVYNPDESP